MNRVPKYAFTEEDGQVTVDFAKMLAWYMGLTLETVFVPPNQVMSWLHDQTGRIRSISWDGNPWK